MIPYFARTHLLEALEKQLGVMDREGALRTRIGPAALRLLETIEALFRKHGWHVVNQGVMTQLRELEGRPNPAAAPVAPPPAPPPPPPPKKKPKHV